MKLDKNLAPLIVILGPTSSGKSALGIKLAKRFKGEIISADSRQVYRSLDIGTAKISKKDMRGIPHHLLDVISPQSNFSVETYKSHADRAIENILKKKHIPFLVGGTGLYIDAVARGMIFPNIPPNLKLRNKLRNLTNTQLLMLLRNQFHVYYLFLAIVLFLLGLKDPPKNYVIEYVSQQKIACSRDS
jgi:tRNA dimethylallyltransferase